MPAANARFNGPIGFVGVGAMGSPMVCSLLRAGYVVLVADTSPERLQAAVAAGAVAGAAGDLVARCPVVCLSLPSSDACVSLMKDARIAPRAGQVFVDFGTTTPPETRRIAQTLAACGVAWIDAPVSGGPGGAERATLRTFVGGDPEVFTRVRPLLETIGGADGLVYCGPSGAGQVVKGVNQLAMGLGAAAFLEAVAFGVRAGADPDVIARAVGGKEEAWRSLVLQTARAAEEGRAERIGVKFRELPYFLNEASAGGFALPLTQTLYDFCDAGPRVVVDDNRDAPSFWRQLMTQTSDSEADSPKG